MKITLSQVLTLGKCGITISKQTQRLPILVVDKFWQCVTDRDCGNILDLQLIFAYIRVLD